MAYDYQAEWGKSEPQRVLDLIKEVGIHRLGNLDGCVCAAFSIRNVEVSISCGKGRDRAVSVSSRSMDYPAEQAEALLGDIAREVQRQVDELGDGRGPIPIRLCGAK